MEKTSDKPKKRKTRLKGTPTHRPCVDCKKVKNRFTEFKPRWAGCATHRTERGRRYHEPGCGECEKLVNGNIRQPRCIECDKARPKKKKAKGSPAPTPAPVVEPQTVVEPSPETDAERYERLGQSVVSALLPEPEPEPEVVGLPEPSPESVQVPVPAVEAKPTKQRPKIASMADLSKLFEDSEETSGE